MLLVGDTSRPLVYHCAMQRNSARSAIVYHHVGQAVLAGLVVPFVTPPPTEDAGFHWLRD